MPYPRCGLLYRVEDASEHLAAHVPLEFQKTTPRWYFMILDEVEDGIEINSFTRHDDQQYWSVQCWQGLVTQNDISIAFEPEALKNGRPEFVDLLEDHRRAVSLLPSLTCIASSPIMAPCSRWAVAKPPRRSTRAGRNSVCLRFVRSG
jgi:hypothetical protein